MKRERLKVKGSEDGSMTVVMTGVIAVLAVLAVALIAQSAGSAQMASTAADQAALAAAHDLLAGGTPGHPCEVAAQVAQRNHAHIQKCAELASSVQVVVQDDARGATATARAGAPPDPGS